MLQFLEGMALYLGFVVAIIAIVGWALYIWEPREKAGISLWMSLLLWPVLPLLARFSNGDSALKNTENARQEIKQSGVPTFGSQGRHARRFGTIREAKEYLVTRIAAEAEREGNPLSEVERKMLYFSETGWTLPDMMAVNAEFERNYDEDAYERKIAELTRKIEASNGAENREEQTAWDLAVEKLSSGDHYLLVLINATEPQGKRASWWLKVLAVFLMLFVAGILNAWIRDWMSRH